MSSSVRCSIIVAGLAATAGADIIPIGEGSMDDPVADTNNTPIVGPNAEASLALRMFGGGNNSFINEGGNAIVHRGAVEFTNIGKNVNGEGDVLAQWEEYPGEVLNTIQVVWMTSNGEDFLPSGAKVGDDPASFLGWVVGESQPFPFGDWVDLDSVEIMNATIAFSSNGGDTFDVFNISGTLDDPWDGTDNGSALPLVGQGINFIVAQYQYDFIPAPGAASVLLVAAGFAARRRR